MRPVLPSDATVAARALLFVPEADRRGALETMLDHARAADCYRKRLGRAHPTWGNGSLMSVALRQNLAAPRFDDLEYLRCLSVVIDTLIARKCAVGGQ